MDKPSKGMGRREFIRVVSGTLVATELGMGCGDAGQPPAPDIPAPPQGEPPPSAGASGPAVTGSSAADRAGGAAAMPANGQVGDGPASPGSSGAAGDSASAGGLAGSGPLPENPMSGAGGAAGASCPEPPADGKARVYVIQAADRAEGISQALAMAGGLGFAAGRDVVLKPNFNSQYEFPATTHDDTIRTITRELQAAGAGNITLADSAGATTGSRTPTSTVIQAKGTLSLCQELGIDFQSYDEPEVEWEHFDFDGISWSGGLEIPKLMRSERVKILLPCCKTHVLAGYTFSMKLAAGLPPRSRRGLISDMHTSLHEKVVDINKGFTPDLVLMDAMMCFIDNGPDTGTTAAPGLIVAASDRVALDAVGVAILKSAGSRVAEVRGKIFETRQIARAVEIGLGVTSPDQIELVGNDDATISELRSILDVG